MRTGDDCQSGPSLNQRILEIGAYGQNHRQPRHRLGITDRQSTPDRRRVDCGPGRDKKDGELRITKFGRPKMGPQGGRGRGP